MRTIVTNSPAAAAGFIRRGELVAFPTETVYGLGADAFDPEAVRKVFKAKGRPPDNPLIVHLGDLLQLGHVARSVPAIARRLIDQFFPGPLTLILPRHRALPPAVSAGRDTVAVRMPAEEIAQAFLRACNTPLAAPSANRSGRPSPTTWQAAYHDLNGRIPCVLQGPPSVAGLESTVIDCTEDRPLLLRAGAITREALQAVVPTLEVADGPALGRSPGTRHRHYAPDVPIYLVDAAADVPPAADVAYIGLDAPPPEWRLLTVAVCPDVAAYAHRLFSFFREAEMLGARHI